VDAAHPDCRHIAFGDLFLEDVRDYRIRLLETTDWTPVFPLWGLPTDALAQRFIGDGFMARLVCVDTAQLDGSFAGLPYSHDMLSALPATVDPCGERGEFHTFVSSGPGFDQSIDYELGEQVLRDDRFMYQELLPR
jgi:diphthamide synthase (EF-2-diphthine--ammonia ligase)